MSVQHLAVGRPIPVPLGQVEVELVDFLGVGAEVALVDDSGGGLPSSVRLSPTRVVLAAPQQATRVIAHGPGGGPFPHGASVQVMIRVGQPPLRADLVGPRTDVGALARPVLVTLTPREDTIEVTAVKVDEAATPPPDEGPLPELARRAFYVARGRTPTDDSGRRGVVVCIDASASMRAHSAVLQSLLEIAFGIDRGMGDAGDVPAFVVTSQVRPLPPLSAGNLAGCADAVFEATGSAGGSKGPESGCRAELLADALGEIRQGRMVLLLTDEVPSGIDACASQWAGDVAEWRVTVIGDPEELLAARGLAGFGMCAVPATLDYGELCDETLGHRALADVIARMTSPQPVGGA